MWTEKFDDWNQVWGFDGSKVNSVLLISDRVLGSRVSWIADASYSKEKVVEFLKMIREAVRVAEETEGFRDE